MSNPQKSEGEKMTATPWSRVCLYDLLKAYGDLWTRSRREIESFELRRLRARVAALTSGSAKA